MTPGDSAGGDHFDLIVIGGGSAGCAAARRADAAGLRVCVVEGRSGGALGGRRVHGSLGDYLLFLREQGWRGEATFQGDDWRAIWPPLAVPVRPDGGIEVVEGRGFVSGPDEVTVLDMATGDERRTVTGRRIVVATGTRPRRTMAGTIPVADAVFGELPSGPVTLVGDGPEAAEAAWVLSHVAGGEGVAWACDRADLGMPDRFLADMVLAGLGDRVRVAADDAAMSAALAAAVVVEVPEREGAAGEIGLTKLGVVLRDGRVVPRAAGGRLVEGLEIFGAGSCVDGAPELDSDGQGAGSVAGLAQGDADGSQFGLAHAGTPWAPGGRVAMFPPVAWFGATGGAGLVSGECRRHDLLLMDRALPLSAKVWADAATGRVAGVALAGRGADGLISTVRVAMTAGMTAAELARALPATVAPRIPTLEGALQEAAARAAAQ